MSRIIQQIATVQFQVDNRKVTASMNALQTEAESLNGKIAAVNQNIKNLGDVPPDNKFLQDYQKQLRQLNSDLKDVTAAQRDLMKGVKAADQLWKAASTQDIESLSIKAIKAGQNGLRKRMENLRPELGGDEQKMYDAYKAVIDEADRVMNVFKSNYATVVQTIRDGGIVSEQAMKSTRDALRDLMESEKEGTAEHRQLAQQYDFLNESLANVAEMRRREKGEIVNANDARREALKLTEDGIAAARRERDMADAVIAGMQQQKSDLDQLRRFHEDRIAQTEREIAANQRLEEAEQDRLADVEKAMRYTENEDRKEAIRLRKKADAARDEAEAKKEAYEQQIDQENLLRQHVKDTGDEVTNLTAKIEALGKTEAPKNNPVLDGLKHEADVAASAIAQLEERLKQLKSPDSAIKPITVENALADRLGVSEGELKISNALNNIRSDAFANGDEATVRAFLRAKGFTGIYDKDSMSDYRSVSKKDMISQLTEYIGNRFSGYDVSDDTYGIASGGKYHDMDWLEEVTEKERQKFIELSYEKQKAWVERVIKKQFGEIDAILYQGAGDSSAYVGKGDSALTGLRSVMNAEVWKGGKSEGPVTQAELDAQQKLITTTKELIQQNDELAKTEHQLEVAKKAKLEIDEKIASAQQQSTTATNDLTEAEKLYNQKVEERIRLEKELEAIKNRSWEDDPEIKRLDKEIAKLDELIAVSDKYKKQFAKMSDSKYEEGYMGGDSEVRKALHIESDPQKSIWGAADYLKGAYHDRSRASLAEFVKEKYPDGGTAAEYQQAAERVAKGIVQNAQENFRRAIYKEIQDGNWTSEAMEQQLDIFRSQFQNEFRNARPGELKDDPEYHYYKYVIEQMEKYIEVARQVEAEREKIAGGKGYMEMARHKDDIDQPQEGLLRQRQKRDWDRATIKTDDIDRRRKEDVRVATEAVTKAKGEEAEAHRKLNEVKQQGTTATKESTQADQQSVDVSKQKAELEEKVKEKTKEYTKAQKDFEAQQEKTNKAQEKAYKAQEESVALNEKAATAEEKVAHQEERHAEAMDQQSERLRQIRAEGQRLLTLYEQQKTEIQAVDKAWADADVKHGEAEARKAQNQELTIKSLDDSIRKLKEANAVIDTNSDEWEENTRIIRKLQQAQDEISQKQKEMMGEWMSLADAQKMADSVGTSGFVATDAQIKQATEALNRHRESLIKTIQERERDGQTTAEERSQLTQLDAQLAKLKTGFGSADEVMQRFNEHMNAGKTASEGMASSINEKLSQATSSYDSQIEDAIKDVEDYEQQIREATQELADMEKELADLEAKHKNSSWFRKQTKAYQREGWRIEDLRDEIEGHEVRMDDGSSFRTGKKQWIEDLQGYKQSAQGWVDYYKKQKAEELGITEEVEEKKQDAQRLTQEQMQQGIKLLEEEYAKTEHTTEAGIKRREQLRETIDQMNQEIKESTGEWMSLAQAEELASKAGTSGFFATQQQMQQATQAIERQRDALVKTIQQKQRDGEATKKEEEELQRLEKVLKDLKFEQDNFNMSHNQMEDLLKHPKKADDLDQLKAAIKRADGELHRMKQSLGDNNDQYRKFAAEVKAAKNELKLMEGQAKATTGQLEKAWSRLKTYVGLYMGFNMAWQKFTGTIGDMKELSDRMGEVGKTTQMAAGEIARMTTNLSKLDTRTALTSLVELSAKAGQLGLKSREDVEGFTEAANKMLVALPEMGADGATQMMKVALATGEVAKIQKEMDDGLIEGSSATAVAMEKIASTIDQLRANSAAAAPQITDFVKRVGAVGAQSGITIDQVAALGSTVDALGLRVEMSATALSRMIPAIKANAFEVAKAIGMAPEALRAMFDEAGGGMNAMLAVFQHIKDSGMDADSIENMLGMGGMRDIMKDLNQQGARAGIVFAGLSQNVDVLREHLGIAKTAYEENIAIQQEYDRMNETTAAKWERLGNQIEEMFVGPGTQSVLGDIADALRYIVDLVAGPLNTAFWSTVGAVSAIKLGLTSLPEAGGKVLDYLRESAAKAGEALQEAAAKGAEMSNAAKGMEQAAGAVDDIGDALEGAQEAGEQAGEAMETATGAIAGMNGATKVSIFSVNGLKMAWKGLDATMKANIIVAVIALLWTLGKAIYNIVTEVYKHNKAVADANAMIQIATDRFEGYWQKLKDTKTALDNAKKSTDGLKEGSDELTKATVEVTKADNNHRAAIADINGIYGKYLGFMLTETNYANLAAAAHDKITAAIRREMLAKQEQAAIDQVTQENTENLKDGLANLTEELRESGRLNSQQAAQAKQAAQKFMRENIKYNADKQDFDINESAYKYLQSKGANRGKLQGMDANKIAAAWFYEYLKDTFHLGDAAVEDITGVYRQGGGYGSGNIGGRHFRGDYASAYLDNMKDVEGIRDVFRGEKTSAEADDKKSAQALVKKLQKQAREAQAKITNKSTSDKERNKAYEDLANSLEGLDTSIDQLNPMGDKELVDSTKKLADDISKSVDKDKLLRARTNARSIFARATGGPGGESPLQPLDQTKNPWGSDHPAESTDWKNMTAEQLVNRRKQMKDFVNAIQTDTDVQSVLKEDAALKAAIEKGMSSDMRTVIEWYNTERLKIQDELHARHLTNTGDWMDPKKERGAKKQFRDEMDVYLHELDAYYTERKTKIEEAGTDEGLTEAEIRNRTLNNEMEWQQRRAELQKLYSRKQKEVTQEELDAIYHIIAERTGDSETFVKAQIAKTNQFVDSIEKSGEKGAAIVHRWMSQVELDTERSYLKGQQALTKQMRAIEAIIDKERPFNGITKSLQESLSTMDILTGEMRKEYNELMKQGKDMTDFNNRQAQEEMKRTAFLLGEAENAYSTTIDNVMDDMRKKGMTAWADWLSADPKLQEALMAQLRSTYDQIQDAIKKEASQLKKQAEIMWNNILMPDGKTTLKQQTDRIVAQLGLDEDRVKRANSLIGAGQASERVADKLAIQQMKVQLAMQEHYYNLMRKQGQAHVDMLNAQAKAAKERGDEEEATRKTLDAQHAQMSLNLATSKEETELAKQREDIIARTEESQNRLYTELKGWADLLASSVKDLFEASHAGDAEYYNERAKLDLTGKGGPGAGTYIVIDNEGTEDATAHYEYLDEREALERQHEIERENAQAEAWRKVMDDINMKMNDTITDMMNAMLQNSAMDANTQAVIKNTEALAGLTSAVGGQGGTDLSESGNGLSDVGLSVTPSGGTDTENPATQGLTPGEVSEWTEALGDSPMMLWQEQSDAATENMLANMDATKKGQQETSKAMAASAQSSFAKMTAAANMYGIAYQAMTNDNLSAEQKFEMMAIQAAGQAAITSLTVDFSAMAGENAINSASVLGKLWSQLGYWAIPVYALFTGLLGGAMGLAVSKIAKSKSEISQATGVSASAGKLTTGMLTYAEGNVNEFTDPSSLTPGRSYNVDGADGKTYRAKYTGKDAKTHITNGPEFHLVGEKGQEAIIDAHTTRLIRMNDTGIWRDIQTLYNGGSLSAVTSRRRGRGIRAFADGNVDEFETMDNDTNETNGAYGFTPEMAASMQASLDRNSEVMEHIAANGIEAFVSPYGPRGVVAGYDKAKKEAVRHGEKFL